MKVLFLVDVRHVVLSVCSGGVFAASSRLTVAMFAITPLDTRPALPSKIKGPTSFRGVIGPSVSVT